MALGAYETDSDLKVEASLPGLELEEVALGLEGAG